MVLSYAAGVLFERYGTAIPFEQETKSFASNIPMHRDEPLLQRWLVDEPGLWEHSPEFVYISRQPWNLYRSQLTGPNHEYQAVQSRGGYPFSSVQNQIWCYPGSKRSPYQMATWNMPWVGRPLWAGLVANAAIYAIVVVAWSYVFASRFRERMRRGQCAHCKYECDDLKTCPECGRDPYLRYAHGIWRIHKPSSGN